MTAKTSAARRGAGPTRGLTLGKYAPLHRGHQLVIETALAEMDEVVVAIYDSPQATDIPLRVRADWIRRLYPPVWVVEAWGGPSAVGYTPAIMRAHERYLLDLLRGCRITHFYSSEPYGAHVSRALGAVDRQVDPSRGRVPVHGTQVRADPFAWRAFLAPEVYADLITRVVLLGAPSTGKTTLARHLAAAYRTRWMPEYGREYWEAHQVDRRLTPAQLVEIAEGHVAREDALALEANEYLFVDTNAMTTATFAAYYHGVVPERLRELAAACGRRYDLTFVCDCDIPYADTWDRSGAANRTEFQRRVLDGLHAAKIPYLVLRGSVAERAARVDAVLARFRKYMNLFDLQGRRG